jgi:hypothetical protein
MSTKKHSPLIGEYGSGVPGDDGGYTEEDWHKAGIPAASKAPLRQTQQTLRQGIEAGALKRQSMVEEQLSLNLATAVSRGVASQSDMVNLPNHYARFKIEPIRFIAENKLDWFQGNIVKYVLRHDAKNGTEDIRKAIRYSNMYLRYLMGDPDWWQSGRPDDFREAA